jgi:hypothetical protein
LVLSFFFFRGGGTRERDKIIGWFHFCNSFNFQENTQQVNENFRKKKFIQVPPKFLPKFQRSLFYTGKLLVIDKIILHFQFHFTTWSNHPESQPNSYLSTQHTLFNNFFFLDSRKPHPPESALCGPRWVSKTPAVQALTRGARPDSNSKPAVQISNLLPSRYVPWGHLIQ